MDRQNDRDGLQISTTVDAPPERAFDVFVRDLKTWWPAEYTWSRDVLDTIIIEPQEGGRCFERGPHGFECDWGRVLDFVPPTRIRFLWQIGPTRAPEPNPEKASEVDVHFEADGQNRTRASLIHRGFARHGEGSDEYRAAMASEYGWPLILRQYEASFE